MLDQRFSGMKEALAGATDEDRQRVNDMLDDLNNLLDKHSRGEDTQQDFRDFMDKHGEFFPENPKDVDELLDYRGSRPQAAFDGTGYTSVDVPEMALYLMYDEADRPFLYLEGPEPDLQWRRLTQAIIDLVEFFEVELVVGMSAIPMAMPHTRPIELIAHANQAAPDRPVRPEGEEGEIIVPAAFAALLEFELGRAGHPAMGYAAQIPHYLTRTDFPAGALALLRRVSDAAQLELPLVE